MRVYLIRHPKPVVAPGICYGHTDLGLVEDAAVCAAVLRPLLPLTTVHSSPLRRCSALANALHPAPLFDDRLREVNFGAWEMRAWDDIGRDALDAWAAAPLNYAPPGGESIADLRRRATHFLDEHRHAGCEELVLVTHAGVMKVCAGELLGLPQPEWFSMSFDYGAITLIEDGRLVWSNRLGIQKEG